ncbi:hypothetical protein P168DRAFT_303206 [Aspergillus campestris IBT 28561]|uniref:Uncharacterized protein n=1 Tax=Aspergillus campestris (strain IBT 28561) TaxID=1392248 RepID=A0A2I1D6A7_ASPC2|nr:uncharacterized protein P168DRAFT_303206 [Aspergillus campestris IBT 28561]PKY05398.1 hypothetical protein P168DRAFT_303206 [Aspergillus campestris IBT 28561]
MTPSVRRCRPIHYFGAASLLSTLVVTVLDGVCLASSRSSPSNTSAIEAAILGLGAISCGTLIVLLVLWTLDVENNTLQPWKDWRAITYGAVITYLAIATATTAALLAWCAVRFATETSNSAEHQRRQPLMISRCVMWAISVMAQGVLGGYLLTGLKNQGRRPTRWPGSAAHELTRFPNRSTSRARASRPPSSNTDSLEHSKESYDVLPPQQQQQQPTASSAASRRSNRYSGRTLYRHDTRRASASLDLKLDLNCPRSIYASPSVTPDLLDEDRDSCVTIVADSRGHELPAQRPSWDKTPFHTTTATSSSSPASSSTTTLASASQPTQPNVPPKAVLPTLVFPDESNIHPLFRPSSSSPPPTPTPGTIVVASPNAGQTITMKMLSRVRSNRSTHSLYRQHHHTPRSRSPLFERMDQVDRERIDPGRSTTSTPQLVSSSSSSLLSVVSGDDHNNNNKSIYSSQQPDETQIPGFIMAADVRSSITRYEKKHELSESPQES